MGADTIMSGGGGNIMGAIGNIGGALLNYGIGQKRNKSARKAVEEANRVAGINVNKGYDTALGALDTGQQALESGYGAAKDTKERISGQMGDVAQQGFDAQSDMWTPWTVPGLNAYQNMDTLLNDTIALRQAAQMRYSTVIQVRLMLAWVKTF